MSNNNTDEILNLMKMQMMNKIAEGAEDMKMFQQQMLQTNQMIMMIMMNNMNTNKS